MKLPFSSIFSRFRKSLPFVGPTSCSVREDFFSLDKDLISFFSSLDKEQTYLLAFSGGCDSLFLFYLLKTQNVPFIAVHVDYGWRASSYAEACALESLCAKEQVPFILRRVPSEERTEKDMENHARRFRYALFRELAVSKGCAGVFLGHHADDQAETVLKRTLEGAHLDSLRGMRVRSYYDNLCLLRPLLHVSKREIQKTLDSKGIVYIRDSTNLDQKFLRGRLRVTIFPLLSSLFGKNIVPPLLTLAEDSEGLSDHLHMLADAFLAEIKEDNVVSLSFPTHLLEDAFLAKWVIREFFRKYSLTVSRHLLQVIYQHMVQRSQVSLRVSRFHVRVDRNIIILPRAVLSTLKRE